MSDAGMAALSDHLFGATMLAYAPAALAFAVEAAFGGARRPQARAEAAPVPLPELAVVGAAPGAVPTPSGRPATARSGVTATRAGGTALRGGAGAGRQGRGGGAVRRGGRAGLLGTGFAVLGLLLHAASIATRGMAAHRIPWANMTEFVSAACFASVAAFLALQLREPSRWLGAFVLGPVLLAMGLAGTVLYTSAGPVPVVLTSTYWLPIHVTAAVLASGVFAVGSTTAMLHLMSLHAAAREQAGRRRGFSAIALKLPPADDLDRLAYRLIGLGFPMWTFAVIAGAIWAESAWGRYWGWDPKETWAFITWVGYAAYLHARSTAGWRGRAASWVAVLGLVLLLLNFFGVNLVVTGKHSYAGV